MMSLPLLDQIQRGGSPRRTGAFGQAGEVRGDTDACAISVGSAYEIPRAPSKRSREDARKRKRERHREVHRLRSVRP